MNKMIAMLKNIIPIRLKLKLMDSKVKEQQMTKVVRTGMAVVVDFVLNKEF